MDFEPARMLRLARGFSCVFWSLPLLSAAHAAALLPGLTPRAATGALLAGYAPLLWGLWRLWRCGALTPRWRRRLGGGTVLVFGAMFLSPFPAWWREAPLQTYLAVNVLVHYLVTVGWLAAMNRGDQAA